MSIVEKTTIGERPQEANASLRLASVGKGVSKNDRSRETEIASEHIVAPELYLVMQFDEGHYFQR